MEPDRLDASRRILAARPDDPRALLDLGGFLLRTHAYDQALAIADAALARRADCPEAWLVRGDALLNMGDIRPAIEALRRAAEAPPLAFQAYVHLGVALGDLGRDADALAAFDQARARDPASPIPAFRRGVLKLKRHDFAAGWTDYERRWDWPGFVETARGQVPRGLAPRLKRWPTPGDFAGRRVVLVAEQASGDTVMFASMMPDLLGLARSVTCVCEPRLVRLLARSFPAATVVGPAEAVIDEDQIDVIVATGSLGGAFRQTADSFPGAPYLRPTPEAADRWRARLGPRQARRRVGLSWRGGVGGGSRAARSMPLETLAPLFELDHCEFVSLQYGDVAQEIAAFNQGRANPLRAFPQEDLRDFDDVAALTGCLDLVVSVQTTQVHLSGGLGVPCLAMVPASAEWRYGAEGERMPWYGSVRLLRQDAPGDWGSVIERVRQALAAS